MNIETRQRRPAKSQKDMARPDMHSGPAKKLTFSLFKTKTNHLPCLGKVRTQRAEQKHDHRKNVDHRK